jgi:hypothetical protein
MNLISYYRIFEHKNGVVHLCITTKEKWLNFQRFSNTSFEVFDQWDELEGSSHQIIEIPELEAILSKRKYFFPLENQCKDEISFYFIPAEIMDEMHPKMTKVEVDK